MNDLDRILELIKSMPFNETFLYKISEFCKSRIHQHFQAISPEEEELIRKGQSIQAIKSVRDRLNFGLKESKFIVDAFKLGAGIQ